MSGAAGTAPGPLELRELRGPAALTGNWRELWRLTWHLARTDFALRYHGSVFGYLWSLVNPLLTFGMLYIVFTEVIKIGETIENYAGLLVLNLTLYQFFSDATSGAVPSIVAKENVVRKLQFPRLAIPLSVVLSATLSLGPTLVVVVILMLATGVPVIATWVLWPALLIALYLFTVGMALLLATLYVSFRDIGQIWSVISRLAFYASPVLFPIEFYPAGFKALLLLNPLAPIFAQARLWILDPDAPSYTEVMGGDVYLIYPILVFVSVIAVGFWYFNRAAPRVAEEL